QQALGAREQEQRPALKGERSGVIAAADLADELVLHFLEDQRTEAARRGGAALGRAEAALLDRDDEDEGRIAASHPVAVGLERRAEPGPARRERVLGPAGRLRVFAFQEEVHLRPFVPVLRDGQM